MRSLASTTTRITNRSPFQNQRYIEHFPDQGSWSYQDRQRGERERTSYDQSTFPYPDRSRSRDRDNRDRRDDYDLRYRDRHNYDRRNDYDHKSFRSVANSATQSNVEKQTETTAGDNQEVYSNWAQLQRDLQRQAEERSQQSRLAQPQIETPQITVDSIQDR